MRLWSVHPKYLDAKGLVALWREGLLAQKVLLGVTKGYTNHPQLERFKATNDPLDAIGSYLSAVADEADRRGYRFNRDKIVKKHFGDMLLVTTGQVAYEFGHLLAKLEVRDPDRYGRLKGLVEIELHPLFEAVEGDIEVWEKV